VVTYGETLEEAQANARGDWVVPGGDAAGWPAYSAPDRDLASPIDQLVAVADADA
jgi:hypothetical protein